MVSIRRRAVRLAANIEAEEARMKYLIQIYGNVTREQVGAMSEDERNELFQAWGAIRSAPGMTPGPEMEAPDTARTVRVEDGRTITTDGPFVETKEALGGYYLVDAPDLDTALTIGKLCPARFGGVEVRPVMTFD
jgi:hypothetical protein